MDNTKYVTLTAEEVASDIDDLLGLAGHLSEIQHWAAQAGAKRLAVLAKKLLDATSAAAPKANQPCGKCEGKGIVPIGDGYSVDGCPECVKQQAEPYTQADCGCTPSEACDICCGRTSPAQQQLSESVAADAAELIMEDLDDRMGIMDGVDSDTRAEIHSAILVIIARAIERALLKGGAE